MPSRSVASTFAAPEKLRTTAASCWSRVFTDDASWCSASAAATTLSSVRANRSVSVAAWSIAAPRLAPWPSSTSALSSMSWPTVSGSRLRARPLKASNPSSGSTGVWVRSMAMTSPSSARPVPASAMASVHAGNSTTLRSPMSCSGSMVARTSSGSGTSSSIVISTRT
jgi:hypothetical protein